MYHKTNIFRITLCLILAILCMVQPAFAADTVTSESSILSVNEILQAVSPLIKAEEVYYDLSDVRVELIDETEKTDGSYDIRCKIIFGMRLRAESVDELPYVSGLLNSIGASDVEYAYEMSEGFANVSHITITPQQSALAAQVIAEIKEIEENMGNDITVTFTVLLNVEEDGKVNFVMGCGEPDSDGVFTTFPLSDYFPAEASEMYSQGASFAAETTRVVNNYDVMPCLVPVNYDRIAARDYAMKYSSNATYNEMCVHGYHYINQSYYNSNNYTTYCHVDCANFVSQAVHAGGIAIDSIWYPGSSAWISVTSFYNYFVNTKRYLGPSTYESCNAGGIIINCDDTGDMYHINMCVLNDTVNHAYAAHNNDHKDTAYTSNYWSNPVLFLKFCQKLS